MSTISLKLNQVIGAEPLLLADVKNFLKVDVSDTTDDTLITALITAARQRAETITGRALVQKQWTYYLDSFPYNWQLNTGPARNTLNRFSDWWSNNQVIRLPKAPLQSIDSIAYIPSTTPGDYVVLDPSTYIVDTTSNPGTVYPIANYYWPYCWTIKNAVQINFTSGYEGDVPEPMNVAMRMMICDWYENRSDSNTTNNAAAILLKGYISQPAGYIDR